MSTGMTDCTDCMLLLSREFKDCQKVLAAMGDETRQQIMISLLESDTHGSRVGEITLKTHLSRSTVSHDLQIFKKKRGCFKQQFNRTEI